MSEAGEFVDAALQREGIWARAESEQARLGSDLRFYGASVGAVRAAIRDAARRYRDMPHDEITALASELWAVPVFERRLAAIVLLQSNLSLLDNSDLTRLEGFVRGARLPALADPLAVDVIGPMIEGLDIPGRARADAVVNRWARDGDVWLRRAAVMSPLRALRAGGGDWAGFTRRAAAMLAQFPDGDGGGVVCEAIVFVLGEVAKTRPELHFPPLAVGR